MLERTGTAFIMKTIFDKHAKAEIIQRARQLHHNSQPQWGKMNVFQMVKHCCIFDEWIQGKGNIKPGQSFWGKLLGRKALKQILSDRPFPRNAPTGKLFTVAEKEGDVEQQLKNWICLMEDYDHYYNPGFIHDFFGKMTKEQIGILVYKHADHHLKQFGV